MLMSTADLLILDEPTNHLDSGMADWLEGISESLPGRPAYDLPMTGTSWTAWVNGHMSWTKGKLYSYQANYEGFLALKAERMEMAEASGGANGRPFCATRLPGCSGEPGPVPPSRRPIYSGMRSFRDQKGPEYDRNVELESIASQLGRTTVEVKDLCKAYGTRC